ncbi:MAG: GNAT family N-acetyltransferase [Bacteroidota bacterium]
MAFEAVDHLTDDHLRQLCKMYQSEWWTGGRKLPEIRRMVGHSDAVIAICDSKQQHLAAFARILTDYVYKALILDVIVQASYRGKGLGRVLMDTILNHPSLKSVEQFELYCMPEMVPFYQKWEFTENLEGLRFMRRLRNTGHAGKGAGIVRGQSDQ